MSSTSQYSRSTKGLLLGCLSLGLVLTLLVTNVWLVVNLGANQFVVALTLAPELHLPVVFAGQSLAQTDSLSAAGFKFNSDAYFPMQRSVHSHASGFILYDSGPGNLSLRKASIRQSIAPNWMGFDAHEKTSDQLLMERYLELMRALGEFGDESKCDSRSVAPSEQGGCERTLLQELLSLHSRLRIDERDSLEWKRRLHQLIEEPGTTK